MAEDSVSVVMPVRNGGATLAPALRSVLAAGADEIVMVDDGSTDGSADVAHGLGDPRIRIVEGPQTGIPGAVNAGIAAVRGAFVAECDADDLYAPGRLLRQRAWLRDNPDFIAISGGYRSMLSDGRPLVDLATEGAPREVTETLLTGASVTHFCTWLTRIEALRAVGGMRDWFVSAADRDLMARLAAHGRVWHDPAIVFHYRLHETSITHSLSDARRRFFDAASERFARQRAETGADDLMRGAPPAFNAGTADAAPKTVRQQAAAQLEGAAWRAAGAGERLRALRLMARAVRLTPVVPRAWRSLAVLALRGGGR